MNKQHLPPADAPDWDSPYNFAWFKFHHLESLQKYTEDITQEYKKHPLGKGFPQDAVKRLLDLTDQLIKLNPWLPNTGGGAGEMSKIIQARKNFEADYLNKPANNASYWHAQEIDMMATDIFNYMDMMCEDE
jgi:hypothetical protein